jgi:hypothetical protein
MIATQTQSREKILPQQPVSRETGAPSITVVCCVESGPLETSTVMMVESLRRWGGRFADIPVIAVTPRFGPPLMRTTHRRFDELSVQHLRRRMSRQFGWYSFLNKPLALVGAEPMVKTDLILWLDADVFITGEPHAFELDAGVDFAACPSDRNLGTSGRGDRYEPYWSRMCDILGLSIDDLPWVQTCREQARIRWYFNGGVLVYRRSSGYGPAYLQGCLDVLKSHTTSGAAGLFFAEQVTAGLIAVKQGLSARALPEQCNYAIGSKALDGFSAAAFSQARVLHYHDALWEHFFPQFMDLCKAGQPALYEWLSQRGPLTNDAPLAWRAVAKGLKAWRQKRQRVFEASCDLF